MIIYHPLNSHMLTFVTPDNVPGVDCSEFRDSNGKPIMFEVQFNYGKAEVMDSLGRYMIDAGLAKSSPIILLS